MTAALATGAATGGVRRIRDLPVEMPDGVRLATDVFLPGSDRPAPALLQRLPYGRTVASSPVLPSPVQLARLGYAVVVQDVRGVGGSDGSFVPFAHEAADGAATVEWVAGQPFCNGRVAMYGFSYQGLDQLQAAALRPAGLAGIAPMMCAATPYELVYDHGCLRWESAAPWAAQLAGIPRDAPRRVADLKAAGRAEAIGDDPPAWFRDWLAHDDPDDPYWRQMAPDLSAVDVPAFTVIGYADTFAEPNARLLDLLADGPGGVEAVCGPWAHMPWGTRLGDLELGPDAGPGPAIEGFLGFLDRLLQPRRPAGGETAGGETAGAGRRRAGARYFVVGDGWHDADRFPPRSTTWTLTGQSRTGANSRHGDGRLVAAAGGAGDLADVVLAEPHVPIPGTGAPFPDVSAVEDRRDVLCYTTDPLDGDRTIAGSPKVRVLARPEPGSGSLVASLVLVDGSSARRLATGAVALPGALPAALPGEPLALVIGLGPVAWRVPAGACLRLDLGASSFPLYARPARGGPEPRAADEATLIEIRSVSLDVPLADGEPPG